MNDKKENEIVCPFFLGKNENEIRCSFHAPGLKSLSTSFRSMRIRIQYQHRFCKNMKNFFNCPNCQIIYSIEYGRTIPEAIEELKELYKERL